MLEGSNKSGKLISFHFSYYIMALFYVLAGYFLNLIIFTILILVHEFGHCLAALLCHFRIDKLVIYPFGGKTTLDIGYNRDIHLELFVASFGVILQFVFYLGICFFYQKYFIRTYVMDLFTLYHREIILFNLLPIYPLDGGKIINMLLCFIFPYRLSNAITIFLSGVSIFFFFVFYRFNYANIMIVSVLLFYLYQFYQKRHYIYQRFLLERYLSTISYPKVKIVKNIYSFYRNRVHFVKRGKKIIAEKNALNHYFQKKR